MALPRFPMTSPNWQLINSTEHEPDLEPAATAQWFDTVPELIFHSCNLVVSLGSRGTSRGIIWFVPEASTQSAGTLNLRGEPVRATSASRTPKKRNVGRAEYAEANQTESQRRPGGQSLCEPGLNTYESIPNSYSYSLRYRTRPVQCRLRFRMVVCIRRAIPNSGFVFASDSKPYRFVFAMLFIGANRLCSNAPQANQQSLISLNT